MQATGTYISRSLSYTGAEFAILRVEVDSVFKVRRRAQKTLCLSRFYQKTQKVPFAGSQAYGMALIRYRRI